MQAVSTRVKGPLIPSKAPSVSPNVNKAHFLASRIASSQKVLPCHMEPRGRAAFAALGSRAPDSIIFRRTSLHVTASVSNALVQEPPSVPDTSDPTTPFPAEALPTHSGYLPVSPSSESKLFYCYYESRCSERPLSETPVLLWLNGGPGTLVAWLLSLHERPQSATVLVLFLAAWLVPVAPWLGSLASWRTSNLSTASGHR